VVAVAVRYLASRRATRAEAQESLLSWWMKGE
jgi:hypothetical protein